MIRIQLKLYCCQQVSIRYSSDHTAGPVGVPSFLPHASIPYWCSCFFFYEGCPENIRPFLIYGEPVAWPWYNLAASQRRPYCTSVNNHSPVGLVSRQWDAVDWACVLVTVAFTMTKPADQLHHHNAPVHSTALVQSFLWQSITSPRSVSSPKAQIWLPATFGFSQSSNRRWKLGDFRMRRSHSAQAQSTASHCRLTRPTGEWLFTDA